MLLKTLCTKQSLKPERLRWNSFISDPHQSLWEAFNLSIWPSGHPILQHQLLHLLLSIISLVYLSLSTFAFLVNWSYHWSICTELRHLEKSRKYVLFANSTEVSKIFKWKHNKEVPCLLYNVNFQILELFCHRLRKLTPRATLQCCQDKWMSTGHISLYSQTVTQIQQEPWILPMIWVKTYYKSAFRSISYSTGQT